MITDALLTASRLLVAISAHSIAQVDETITFPQLRTLVILSNRGPVNLATLATLLGVQPSATGRMVDRLVSAGMIDRLPHPTSRRELLAALTKRGREVVAKVTANRRAEIARIVEQMPVAERHGLVRALTAFTAAGGEPDAHVDIDQIVALLGAADSRLPGSVAGRKPRFLDCPGAPRLRRDPRTRATRSASPDRLAAPRRHRGADQARRGVGPAGQAGAVAGGSRGARSRHSGAASVAAELGRVRRGTVGVGAAMLRGGGLRGAARATGCSRFPRAAGSTCTSRCCRPGAARRRCRPRSRQGTRSPEPRHSRSNRAWTPGRSTASSPRPSGRPTPREICLTDLRSPGRRCCRRRWTASPTKR